jgi:formylglycine-generating enzyme required for sulfatase activity
MNTQKFEFKIATIAPKAREPKIAYKHSKCFKENLGNGVALEIVAIPGGTFMMGSLASEGYDFEKPQHRVTVKPFYMGKHPITQAQWQIVAALAPIHLPLPLNPSKHQGANLPVERVSWYEAIEFCQRLSKLSGRSYRLPCEAEWEYACRAGTTTPFHFGRKLPKQLANSYDLQPQGQNSKKTTPIGAFEFANAFGLYDLHGNIYEWCLDLWHDSYERAPCDGRAWLTTQDWEEELRVIRGGFWLSHSRHCRSAYRDNCEPDSRSSVVGLRVACDEYNPLNNDRSACLH